jgi:toxin secretion/phage lysis holin
MKELWVQASYFFSQIWAGMLPVKAPLSLALGFYSGYLGGDWLLLLVFTAMIVIDLVFGTWLAIRRQRFEVRLFGRWVVKAGTHFFVIAVVGVAIRSILEPLSISFPLLDLFLGLLICTEALSVLKNMKRLGLPVPRLAARILTDAQGKAEKLAEDFFSRPENDRRRRPRAELDPAPGGKAFDDDQPD